MNGRISRLAGLTFLLGTSTFPACSDSSRPRLADLDNDGIPDISDTDLDNDGVLNQFDAFPRDPLEFYDSDGDGVGNLRQRDEDLDGVADEADAFPFDRTRSAAAVYTEAGFNDNLGLANATSPRLVGVSMPPDDLSVEDRFVRIRGTAAPAADTDVFLIAPPAGVDVSFVLRSTEIGGSVEHLRLGLIALDGSGLPSSRIPSTAVERATGIWRRGDGAVVALVVSDIGAAAQPVAYEIEFCVDSDHDGVGDDRELALGSRTEASDSDGDSLTDLDEIVGIAAFDPDGDVAPTWLDRDSDGDGWLDRVESALDSDRDGLPNHVDTDADGNDTDDSAEPSLAGVLLDFDGDDVLDAFDLDDDDDGLGDREDADRRARAMVLEAGTGSLHGCDWLFQGVRIRSIVRPGGALRLRGDSFGSAPAERFVAQFTRGPNRRGETWTAVPVTLQANGELEALVPVHAADGWVRLLDRGLGRVTRDLPLRVVGSEHPVVTTAALRMSGGNLAILAVLGSYSAAGLTIEWNGRTIAPLFVTTTQVAFTVPTDAESGEVRLVGPFGTSNSVPVAVTRGVTGSITLPPGSPASGVARTLSVGAFSPPLSLGTAGSFSATVPGNAPSLLSVSRTLGDGTPLLLAVADPASTVCNVDIVSTAIALAWGKAELQLSPSDSAIRRQLLNAVSTAPSLALLRQELESLLVADSEALAAPTDSLRARIQAVASEALGTLASAAPAVAGASRFTIEPDTAYGFTPRETSSGLGIIEVDNDTRVFASAAMYELTPTGQVVSQRSSHVASYFAPAMIDSQGGAPLFLSSVTRLQGLPTARTLLQIITAGRNSSSSSLPIDPAAYMAVTGRTLLSNLIIPVTNQALGRMLGDDQFLLELLIEAIGPTLENALTNYQQGFSTLAGAVLAVLEAITDDLLKPLSGQPSAILTAYLKRTSQQLAASAVTDLARRVVGNLVAFLRIYSLAVTTFDAGATEADLQFVPAGMDFLITSDLQIDQLDPVRAVNYHWGTTDWDLPLRVIGTGMLPAGGYEDWQASRHRVAIRVDGGRFPADSILPSGTSTIAVLRQQDVEDLFPGTLPVDVEVDFQLVSNELELQVFDHPVVDRISPATGRAGDLVDLVGIGFDPRTSGSNSVEFQGATGPVGGTVVSVSPNGRRLTVRVPPDAISGPVKLTCQRPDDELVESNEVEFRVAESTITYWDSGNLKDDIFSLYLENQLLANPSSPVYPPLTIPVALEPGRSYLVLLRGVSAPDQIGTYSISFSSDIEVLPGSDPLSGDDLIAGASKYFSIWVPLTPSAASARLEPDPSVVLFTEPVLPAPK